MSFGSMSEWGTIDAAFIWRKTQEECHAKGKKMLCLVDLEKAFYRVSTKVLE